MRSTLQQRKKAGGLPRSSGSASTSRANLGSIPALSFFFSSRRRHTEFDCDWSSDVCSSDLTAARSSSGLPSRRRTRYIEPGYWSRSESRARNSRSSRRLLPSAEKLSFESSRSRLVRSEEHTSELQSQSNLVCRLLLEKKKTT